MKNCGMGISDCGMGIADCGFTRHRKNPQSEIPNPKSQFPNQFIFQRMPAYPTNPIIGAQIWEPLK
jgi:hypothetical protein